MIYHHVVKIPLKKFYIYKLSTNLISLAINVDMQAIIPRELGPKAYGNFHFLSNFTQTVKFWMLELSLVFIQIFLKGRGALGQLALGIV